VRAQRWRDLVNRGADEGPVAACGVRQQRGRRRLVSPQLSLVRSSVMTRAISDCLITTSGVPGCATAPIAEPPSSLRSVKVDIRGLLIVPAPATIAMRAEASRDLPVGRSLGDTLA
jgi:hypothetical protein